MPWPRFQKKIYKSCLGLFETESHNVVGTDIFALRPSGVIGAVASFWYIKLHSISRLKSIV